MLTTSYWDASLPADDLDSDTASQPKTDWTAHDADGSANGSDAKVLPVCERGSLQSADCRACEADDDCAGLDNSVCDTSVGECVQCTLEKAAACSEGDTCVAGTCAGWTAPSEVSGVTGTQRLALSADGTKGLIVWLDYDDTSEVGRVYAASYSLTSSGGEWSAPVIVSDEAAGEFINPDSFTSTLELAMSADGSRALVVWSQGTFRPTAGQVYASYMQTRSGDAHWSPASPLAGDPGSVGSASVALSEDGSHGLVTWSKRDPEVDLWLGYAAALEVEAEEVTWGSAVQLGGVGTLAASSDLSLAGIAWVQREEEEQSEVFCQWLDSKGWSQPKSVGSAAPRDRRVDDMVLSADGQVALLGMTEGGVTSVARSIAGMTFGNAVQLSTGLAGLQLTASGDGRRATGLWKRDIENQPSQLYAAWYSEVAGIGAWSQPTRVSDGKNSVAGEFMTHDLASSRDGMRSFAIWSEISPTVGVHVSRLEHLGVDVEFNAPVKLSDTRDDSPMIAVSHDGLRALAAWHTSSGMSWAAFGPR